MSLSCGRASRKPRFLPKSLSLFGQLLGEDSYYGQSVEAEYLYCGMVLYGANLVGNPQTICFFIVSLPNAYGPWFFVYLICLGPCIMPTGLWIYWLVGCGLFRLLVRMWGGTLFLYALCGLFGENGTNVFLRGLSIHWWSSSRFCFILCLSDGLLRVVMFSPFLRNVWISVLLPNFLFSIVHFLCTWRAFFVN